MITDSEYRDIGVGLIKVAIVVFAIGVLTGYLIS
jgi:cytochrome bd-type quinol oxidase subunit 1